MRWRYGTKFLIFFTFFLMITVHLWRRSQWMHDAQTNLDDMSSVKGKEMKTFTHNNGSMSNPYLTLGGMFDNGETGVTENVSDFLLAMSCAYNVEIFVLVRSNPHSFMDNLLKKKTATSYVDDQEECANRITVHQQPANIDEMFSGRVDRLAHARDFLRDIIRKKVEKLQPEDLEKSMIGLIDLDLLELPPPSKIIKYAYDIALNKGRMESVDILCSAGVTKTVYYNTDGEEREELKYYDTFATIFLPDTFLKNVNARLIKQQRPEEDGSFIEGATVNHVDILKWIEKRGSIRSLLWTRPWNYFFSNSNSYFDLMKPVPVRSCFGGMALYRASKYFDQRCSYLTNDPSNIKYAIEESSDENDDDDNDDDDGSEDEQVKGGEICEHVVFHECLNRIYGVNDLITIAIQPDLQPAWEIWHIKPPYYDLDWSELPVDAQNAAQILGYNQTLWDGSDSDSSNDEENDRFVPVDKRLNESFAQGSINKVDYRRCESCESKVYNSKDSADDNTTTAVAWLMSFPNSGTSYTIHLVRESSNHTTATNYALEGEIKDQPSVPAISSSEDGPFLELIPNRTTTVPSGYVLTKTHCGGTCADCNDPLRYLETMRSFQVSCQTGRRATRDDKGVLKLSRTTYDASLVKKAVHIIRDPIDNIVSRFHHEHKMHKQLNDHQWIAEHPNNQTGFQKWCSFSKNDKKLLKASWVDKTLRKRLKNPNLPCVPEFFRYIQWHNNAFSLSHAMNIPTLVVHYDDYNKEKHNATLDRLLMFLNLPRVGDGILFENGKDYKHWYSADQRLAVKMLIEEFATAETWQELKRYR